MGEAVKFPNRFYAVVGRKKFDGSCGFCDDARLPGNAEFFCEAGVDGADGCQ